MKRKNYCKPTMQIVKLEHQCHLMQASRNDYQSVEWSRELNGYYDEEDD